MHARCEFVSEPVPIQRPNHAGTRTHPPPFHPPCGDPFHGSGAVSRSVAWVSGRIGRRPARTSWGGSCRERPPGLPPFVRHAFAPSVPLLVARPVRGSLPAEVDPCGKAGGWRRRSVCRERPSRRGTRPRRPWRAGAAPDSRSAHSTARLGCRRRGPERPLPASLSF